MFTFISWPTSPFPFPLTIFWLHTIQSESKTFACWIVKTFKYRALSSPNCFKCVKYIMLGCRCVFTTQSSITFFIWIRVFPRTPTLHKKRSVPLRISFSKRDKMHSFLRKLMCNIFNQATWKLFFLLTRIYYLNDCFTMSIAILFLLDYYLVGLFKSFIRKNTYYKHVNPLYLRGFDAYKTRNEISAIPKLISVINSFMTKVPII